MSGSERGQTTIELVLCLPVLMLLAAFLVEAGGLAVDNVRVWHAAREAARVATVTPDEAEIRAAAERSGMNGLSIEVVPASQDRIRGEPVSVAVSFRAEPSIGLLAPIVERVTMQARAVMRIEQP